MEQQLTRALNMWRFHWRKSEREPFGLPSDDDAWDQYVDGLKLSEVLRKLALHDD